jgi:hexosaminidase
VGRHDASDVKFDGQRHGGYYTQDEIKEVVRYAADRYVTVELRSKNRLLKE